MDIVAHLKNTGQNSDRFVSIKVDFIRVKSYRVSYYLFYLHYMIFRIKNVIE